MITVVRQKGNNMRELIFRGKHLDNGEWVQGYYVCIGGKHHYILTGKLVIEGLIVGFENIKVDPATVGQYTGLTDKNGTMIFEGDVLEVKNKITYNTVVKYGEYTPDYFIKLLELNRGTATTSKFYGLYCETLNEEHKELVITNSTQYLKVIGNIHDNKQWGFNNGN